MIRFTLPKARKFLISFILVALALIAGWLAGKQDFGPSIQRDSRVTVNRSITPQDVNFSLFWEVWDRLENSYFDKSKIDSGKLVYGAIKGMVAAVGDPYTVFLPPAEQKRTLEDLGGEFEGVGIQIGFKGSRLAVIAPLEGTPADRAGVLAGDFIVGIKDDAKEIEMGTFGMTLPEAVEAIRGPSGSVVTLVLTREGREEAFDVDITREKIEVPSVELVFLEDGPSAGSGQAVAHLKLLRFGEQTDNEWDEAIEQIEANGFKGVILDLRNNPGGFLNGSVNIASEFLRSGVVVIQEDGRGQTQEFRVTGRARIPSKPLVVLVNGGSASASEIVAGALRDHGRAKLVGEKTFGKGTIQESQELDSSGLHITTARWLTPKGTWVDEQGLEPDIIIKDDPETEEDEQLEAALRLLK